MDIGGVEPPSHLPVVVPRMPIAARVLYMIVFGLTFWILTWILAVAAIAQLILTALGGQPNPELLKFSQGYSRYVTQVIEFLLFMTDKPPFPFAPWPDRMVIP